MVVMETWNSKKNDMSNQIVAWLILINLSKSHKD